MSNDYSDKFFSVQQDGSIASADVVVPEVLRLFKVSSVVDFGCGVGGWLAVFRKHGVGDVLGIDAGHVPIGRLKISKDQFLTMDLTAIQPLPRKYELACSLEVAEHLPEHAADQMVAALVAAAPIVLFSAAVPFQGGVQHLNEQWQSYWAHKFDKHGYVAVDCIRPLIFGDARVEWWYRQNTLIYCQSDKVPSGHRPVSSAYELDRIDAGMANRSFAAPASGTQAIARIREAIPALSKALPRAISRAVSRTLLPR